ncbi:DUF922 domain-containing protein [Sphingomonas sp. LM7]|uniref:DUF922 domain-containing protein n=1 Tax=Sphingomonas sp. LM7 TaxID=1938607 RepID=UPI00098398B6|nr:DUF922 domain-containing protein [Sphingomonas sp. LM7]AQR73902.1 hypothetical protein BXU08_09810 [Sphingomonas sp. LM7]
MPTIRYATALILMFAPWGVSGSAQSLPRAAVPDAFRDLPNVTVEYYDLHGSDEESINASLTRNAPTRPDGTKAMGATGYKVGYRPFQLGTGPACKVTKLKVALGAVVTLPRLADESVVPERILAKWRPFIAALREHEAGHVRIHYRHMREIEAALIGSRCDQLEAKFLAAAGKIEAFQRTYDRETNHGATQGAILQ